MKKVFGLIFCLAAWSAFGQTTEDEWYEKAGEYYNSGEYAKAITAYSEVIKRNGASLNAYWFRGLAYFQIDNYDAAVPDFDTVIKGAPDFSMAYVVRGDLYGIKGLYHKAVGDYRTGLEKGYDISRAVVDKSNKADMWFCGTIYIEIVVNRFLGNSAEVTKYENWLKTVCDKNKVTRAEVETFYRQNIGALISAAVDAEFNKISFMVDRNYSAVLKRNPQTGQYKLSYVGVGRVTKELPSVSSLESLSSAMSKSGDFSATAFNEVRSQSAFIPAVTKPVELDRVKKALMDFYVNPNQNTFGALKNISNGYSAAASITPADGARLGALIRTLSALSPDLARKL